MTATRDLLFEQRFNLLKCKIEAQDTNGNSQRNVSENITELQIRELKESFALQIARLKKIRQERAQLRQQKIERLRLLRERVCSKSKRIVGNVQLRNLQFQRRLDLQSRTVSKRLQELIFECVGEIEKVCLESSLHSKQSASVLGDNVNAVALDKHWLNFSARVQEDSIGAIRLESPKLPRQGMSPEGSVEQWYNTKQAIASSISRALQRKPSHITISHVAAVHVGSSKQPQHGPTSGSVSHITGADRSVCKLKRIRQNLYDTIESSHSKCSHGTSDNEFRNNGDTAKLNRKDLTRGDSSSRQEVTTPAVECMLDSYKPEVKTISNHQHLLDSLFRAAGVTWPRGQSRQDKVQIEFDTPANLLQEYASNSRTSNTASSPAFFRRVRNNTIRLPNWAATTLLSSSTIRWLVDTFAGPEHELSCSRVYYCIESLGTRDVATTSLLEMSQFKNSRIALAVASELALQATYGRQVQHNSKDFPNTLLRYTVTGNVDTHRQFVAEGKAASESCISCGRTIGNSTYRARARTPRSFMGNRKSSSCVECVARTRLANFPDVIVAKAGNNSEQECHFAAASILTLLRHPRFASMGLCSFSEYDRKSMQSCYGLLMPNGNELASRNATVLYVSCWKKSTSQPGEKVQVLVPLPIAALDELLFAYLVRGNVVCCKEPKLKSTTQRSGSNDHSAADAMDQVAWFPPTANASSLWETLSRSLVNEQEQASVGIAILDIVASQLVFKQLSQSNTSSVSQPQSTNKVGKPFRGRMGEYGSKHSDVPDTQSTSLQGIVVVFKVDSTPDASVGTLSRIESADTVAKNEKEKEQLCEWRSCLAPAITYKHLALKERNTVKQFVCRHHSMTIDRLLKMNNGIQEIKRHVPRQVANESKKRRSVSKAENERALVKASSLVSELLNKKLANTIQGFCSRAAAAARPKTQTVGPNTKVTGTARVAKVKAQESALKEEVALLRKIAQVECRVESELRLFEGLGVFPASELSAIRHEYNVLSEQKPTLLGLSNKTVLQRTEKNSPPSATAPSRKRDVVSSKLLRNVPDFLLVKLSSLEDSTTDGDSGDERKETGIPHPAVLDTLGLRSVARPSSVITLAHLELEFSLRKFVLLSKSRRELEMDRYQNGERGDGLHQASTKVRTKLQQRLNESIRYSTL